MKFKQQTDSNEDIAFGTFSHIGKRSSQEDGALVVPNFNEFLMKFQCYTGNHSPPLDYTIPRSFFAVLDGHAGSSCMKFVKRKIVSRVTSEYLLPPHCWAESMRRAILSLEHEWTSIQKASENPDDSGTTITVCVLEGDVLHCAWVGDSPCYINFEMSGVATEVTSNHRPDNEIERNRIEAAGGMVYNKEFATKPGCFLPKKIKIGPSRVFPGGLAVSRSIGDLKSKLPERGGREGTVIADPGLKTLTIPKDARFIVVCTDGLSDNIDNDPGLLATCLKKGFYENYNSVKEGYFKGKTSKMNTVASLTAERAVYFGMNRCKKRHTQDNVTVVVLCMLQALNVKNLDNNNNNS